MLSRLSRVLVILALWVSIGAHWAALQSVAWATMLVENAQHESLAQAVAQTFDGQHQCDLCKHITAAQHEQKQNEAQPVNKKQDLICATRAITLLPRSADFPFPPLVATASRRVATPPTPPPRSALS